MGGEAAVSVSQQLFVILVLAYVVSSKVDANNVGRVQVVVSLLGGVEEERLLIHGRHAVGTS